MFPYIKVRNTLALSLLEKSSILAKRKSEIKVKKMCLVENNHEVIISKEEFKKVQEIMNQ